MKTTPEALQRQAEIAAKDARIALLEVLTKQLDEYAPLNDALARAEKAEARIAELEDERAAYIPREIYVTSERDKAIARAEKAEAELAEAKAALEALNINFDRLRDVSEAARYPALGDPLDARENPEAAQALTEAINEVLAEDAQQDRQIAALSERLTCFEHMAGEDLQRADEDARQIATLREALELFVKRFMEQPLAEIRHPRDDYRNARAALHQDKPVQP